MRDINIKFFIGLSLLLVIIRLLFISNTLLINDEAYYAIYARHLAWGYVDHGPIIAYLIKFFTLIWENNFTVRLGATTLMSILTIILYYFGNWGFIGKQCFKIYFSSNMFHFPCFNRVV